jgi:lipopolysaccharide biosynthesis glycosyltransferase
VIDLFVGYDPREAAAYHVFTQSVLNHSTVPVRFVPLSEKCLKFDGQQDGSNAFIYSRYLVPFLKGYEGWAMFADGDMVCLSDIAELWALRDESFAVQVVKHEYTPRDKLKYRGSPMESPNIAYPRKNWSSVMLFNCGHPSNKALTREVVATAGGQHLHRFQWLKDEEIGELPREWNLLVGEMDGEASLAHYTLGVPGFAHYQACGHSREWHQTLLDALHVYGENAHEMVKRAYG